MKVRHAKLEILFAFLALFGEGSLLGRPEAFEVGKADLDELPGGKEADGIVGDFVLRNDRVAAVISCDAPLRRANMSTFYGEDGVTPGCLYDLTMAGEDNDQITVFAPLGQRGTVSYVRVVKTGEDGEAIIESVVSGALGNGLAMRHEYRLRNGWQGVVIVSEVRNEGSDAREVVLRDGWTRFERAGQWGGVHWADANDPADRCGYAFGRVSFEDVLRRDDAKVELAPGESIRLARFLAVGRSPAAAYGSVATWRGEALPVRVVMQTEEGEGLTTGRVVIELSEKALLPGYPNGFGEVLTALPEGEFRFRFEDMGRRGKVRRLKVGERDTIDELVVLGPSRGIIFDVRDGDGKLIPCKVQFIGIDGTPSPELGPSIRAHGCRDQYHSERGDFRVPLPGGRYRVVVTRGPEFNHYAEEVELGDGDVVVMKVVLDRVVDTTGWVSADFHNHSTPSGDNVCGTDDRVINLVAEQIEFAPTTEHNRLYDWAPHIERLGLGEQIYTVPGVELTGRGAHFNMFPLEPEPGRQDAGAPVWQGDPRLNAVVLRGFQGEEEDRWVQINHPDMVENFVDRNGDGKADGGYLALPELIDGVEVQNYRPSNILVGAPFRIGKARGGLGLGVDYFREFIWLQLLNQGHRIWGVAVSDAHAVHGNGVGGWRVYLPSSTDEPEELDWRELVRNALAGRMILSTGPFLEVGTDGGAGPGDTESLSGASDEVYLSVRVQCADWLDIDRVQVLVNGRQPEELNFRRATHPDLFNDGVVKFDERISVAIEGDSHLIVVAYGENHDLSIGYGSSGQAALRPCAYNNPIFVDGNGDGFKANGDTLGFELPVKRLSVKRAREMLEKNGLEELMMMNQ
ncbi:MAG: CehA/McbA family metallohydrolase [Verrucomicrobiota bacterium]